MAGPVVLQGGTIVTMRIGDWCHQVLYKHRLTFRPIDGLLATAGCKGAAQKKFNDYWSERCFVQIPDELSTTCTRGQRTWRPEPRRCSTR